MTKRTIITVGAMLVLTILCGQIVSAYQATLSVEADDHKETEWENVTEKFPDGSDPVENVPDLITVTNGTKGYSKGIWGDPRYDNVCLEWETQYPEDKGVEVEVKGRANDHLVFSIEVKMDVSGGGNGTDVPPPPVGWAEAGSSEPDPFQVWDENVSDGMLVEDDSSDDPGDEPDLYCAPDDDGKGRIGIRLFDASGTYPWELSNSDKSGQLTDGSDPEYSTTISGINPGTHTVSVRASGGYERAVRLAVVNVEIISLSLNTALELGDDLVVEYELDGPLGCTFDSVELVVSNSDDKLVYKDTGLSATMGTHSATWKDAKWNQSPHSGAYANPNSGNYKIKVVAKKGPNFECGDEESINTKFIIEADVEDKTPSGADASAEPSGLGDLGGAVEVVVKKDSTSHTLSGGSLALTDIADGKHLRVDNATLNSLADGTWTIQLKDVRDEIGNFYDSNPSTGGIDHYEWTVELQ